jgi:bacterioferritin-associated ferredoxin
MPDMQPDDKICYCYHVSLRKLYHYARRNRPQRASQMSNCLNAGTGCGWCIPILKRIHERVADGWELTDDQTVEGLPATAEEYAEARQEYIKSDTKNSFDGD